MPCFCMENLCGHRRILNVDHLNFRTEKIQHFSDQPSKRITKLDYVNLKGHVQGLQSWKKIKPRAVIYHFYNYWNQDQVGSKEDLTKQM